MPGETRPVRTVRVSRGPMSRPRRTGGAASTIRAKRSSGTGGPARIRATG